MLPYEFEKEAVNQAFELIKSTELNADQRDFLRLFLEQYARDPLNIEQVNKIFRDKIKMRDAIKTLHDFVKQYEIEDKAFSPFKEKAESVLSNLPRKPRSRL